jgi:hypothetical protein
MAELKVRTQNFWSRNDNILKCECPGDVEFTVDLERLFSDFPKLSETQKEVIVYGVKQKLSDKSAKIEAEKLTPENFKIVSMARYEDILDGSAWVRKAGGTRETAVLSKSAVNKIKQFSIDQILMFVELFSEAEMKAEHKRTLWDSRDFSEIEKIQDALPNFPLLDVQLEILKAGMDELGSGE